jgi:TonB family protein
MKRLASVVVLIAVLPACPSDPQHNTEDQVPSASPRHRTPTTASESPKRVPTQTVRPSDDGSTATVQAAISRSSTHVIQPEFSESDCDMPLRAVSMNPPPSPDNAKREGYFGRSGTLELQLTILETGSVADVKVVKPMNPFWDPLFVEAARSWSFEPCMKDGSPRAVSAVVTITMKVQ